MPENAVPEVRALRTLHDLITTVHSVQDLAEVLQTVAQGVVDVLGFHVAVINTIDAYDFVEAVAVAGDEGACRTLRNRRMPLAQFTEELDLADEWGLLRFVPHDRLPPDVVSSWIPDMQPLDDPDAWHPLDALYAPLHGPGGDLLGVLSVDLPEDGMRPGPLSRQILEMYAVQAGLAIHHAQERDRLQERVRLAAATRTIVDTASRELDLVRVVDQSFGPLRSAFLCDFLLIRVFDAPGDSRGTTFPPDLVGRLRRGLGVPGEEEVEDPIGLLAIGEHVSRICWAEARTCVVAELGDTSDGIVDATSRRTIERVLAAAAALTAVLVPLGDGPDCLGYLILLRRAENAVWHQEEDEAALEVAREMGRAVARARLYQRERQLVTELQELDAYKGEMIATITHELKTPLTSIAGHVELLQESDVSPVSIGAIARNTARLQTLVEDMLLLTTMKDPHRPFVAVLVDLSGVVKEVCDSLAIQASRRNQVIDTSGVAPGVRVWGEPDEIARLLTNVLGNAIKYTPDGGAVSLGLDHDGTSAVITCSDTGIGIAEQDVGTLFEEFDRSSNPAAHALPGTGLGLAIVRRIVDRHQGSISVESTLGSGSTFRVVLPNLADA